MLMYILILLLFLECSKTCQTCKNDDKDYCLLCKTVAILTGTTCICPIGMYSDGNGVC